MTSQKKRYLLIALFFIVLTIVAALPIFQGNFDRKNLLYMAICAFIGILFLKNALTRQ